MKKVVTHNGKFHADEVFGVATLQLAFGTGQLEIIRTRDESAIATADIVLDVGGEYDSVRFRFDHHQVGAPVRENGIPYAAFGLVWKSFGEQVTSSREIADKIDKKLAQAIDAGDNGVALYTLNGFGVAPLEVSTFIESFMPPLGSTASEDVAFHNAVAAAREYLQRVIEQYRAKERLRIEATRVYEAATDKRVLVFDTPMKPGVLSDFTDVLVVVSPRDMNQTAWSANTVAEDDGVAFSRRAFFPESWAGLRDRQLATASGIADAIFCHKGGFIFVAESKEGAVAAAKQIVEK